LGGRSPPTKNRMFIAALCGGAAWTAEVKNVRRVQPPSQPPPAAGRSRVPAPGGGGSGRGPSACPRSRAAGGPPALPGHVHRAWCAPRLGPDYTLQDAGPMDALRRTTPAVNGCAETWFPHVPACRYLFTPGVTHAPASEGVSPPSRLRGQAARAPRRNVNTYACRGRWETLMAYGIFVLPSDAQRRNPCRHPGTASASLSAARSSKG